MGQPLLFKIRNYCEKAQNRFNPVLSFFLLLHGLCSLPGIVTCDVVDDLDGTHAPIPELDMGLGVVADGEVDFGGAFVVEGLFGDMIVKAPVS